MLNRIRQDEKGFTLIELLVVILIIGVLAAIALPAFLGQRAKGQDAAAKSDVRNAVTEIESCFVEYQDYTVCDGSVPANVVLPADVTVTGATAQGGYTINRTSKSNNEFSLTRSVGNADSRDCVIPATGTDKGGCPSTLKW